MPEVAPQVIRLIKRFDASLPALRKMRNVLEHADDYGVVAHLFDTRRARHPEVHRQQVQTMSWNKDSMTWLGEALNYDDALNFPSTIRCGPNAGWDPPPQRSQLYVTQQAKWSDGNRETSASHQDC